MIKRSAVALWSSTCRLLQNWERNFFCSGNFAASPFTSGLKVALVKQSCYCDIYTDPSTRDPKALLASSIHRTGPIGLFINFDTTFIIVHPEADPECRVWEQKLAYESDNNERSQRFPKLREQQAAVAVRAGDVDWSVYDLVIAFENAVPAAVTRKHPTVLWCTLLEHHKMKPYKAYLKQVPEGYDAFLNLRFGPNPQSIGRRPHVIDFPYGLNDVSGLAALYRNETDLRCVMLEDHQDRELLEPLLQDHGFECLPAGESSGLLDLYHQRLSRAAFLLAPRSSRPLGGLASIDAAAMDCLIIGNRFDSWNPFIMLPELQCSREDKAVRIASELAGDDTRYKELLQKQQARLHWFAWVRPLRQIEVLAARSQRKLSISSRALAA